MNVVFFDQKRACNINFSHATYSEENCAVMVSMDEKNYRILILY